MTEHTGDEWPKIYEVEQLPDLSTEILGRYYRVGGRSSSVLHQAGRSEDGSLAWQARSQRELLTLALFNHFGFAPANPAERGYPLTLRHALGGAYLQHHAAASSGPGGEVRYADPSAARDLVGGHDPAKMVDVTLTYRGRMTEKDFLNISEGREPLDERGVDQGLRRAGHRWRARRDGPDGDRRRTTGRERRLAGHDAVVAWRPRSSR